MIDESLIRKFLQDACEPEEAALVSAYLREHPEEVERLLPEAEFMELDAVAAGAGAEVPETVSAQWLEQIHRVAGVENGRVRRLWIRRLSVAAAVGGLIFGVIYFSGGKASSPLARLEKVIPADMRERKENRTRVILPVVLPDGSMIRMMPEAIVMYNKKFKDNRDVYLEGEADFEVTTDKEHSFTVYSGEVSTKVLGTSFRVKALRGEDTITVRLNTGKVLVRAELQERKTMEDVNLLPGQELRYSRKAMTATVRNFNIVVKGSGLVKAGIDGARGVVRPDWYKFSNQPMKAVLDQLSDYYGVAIYYSPADIATLYFDGKFEKTDSLEKILMDITLPNDLRFVREDSGYIIRKR